MTAVIATTNGETTLSVPQGGSLAKSVEALLLKGDLSTLGTEERLVYYQELCHSVGLNPLTKPFDFISTKGKVTLYPNRSCAAQLSKLNGVTVEIVSRDVSNGIATVVVRASMYAGDRPRHVDAIGCVSVAGLEGQQLANAYMHASTKAERRAVLNLCGLGLLDESEVVDLPAPTPAQAQAPQVKTLPAPSMTPTRLDALVSQIREECQRAKLTGTQWAQFAGRAPWNGRKPGELTASEAEQMLVDLRQWLTPTTGADGLPLNQEGTGAQPGTFPGTGK